MFPGELCPVSGFTHVWVKLPMMVHVSWMHGTRSSSGALAPGQSQALVTALQEERPSGLHSWGVCTGLQQTEVAEAAHVVIKAMTSSAVASAPPSGVLLRHPFPTCPGDQCSQTKSHHHLAGSYFNLFLPTLPHGFWGHNEEKHLENIWSPCWAVGKT